MSLDRGLRDTIAWLSLKVPEISVPSAHLRPHLESVGVLSVNRARSAATHPNSLCQIAA
jgi:hypothetical protein